MAGPAASVACVTPGPVPHLAPRWANGAAALVIVCVAYVGPASTPASAATVAREGSALVYRGSPGEVNRVTISLRETYDSATSTWSSSYSVSDYGAVLEGCSPMKDDERARHCESAGVTKVEVDLGDGDDLLDEGNVPVPMHARGGDGADILYDGAGEDVVEGGAGDDQLRTTERSSDTWSGGDGADRINALDNTVDTIRCGPGADAWVADPRADADPPTTALDALSEDCEARPSIVPARLSQSTSRVLRSGLKVPLRCSASCVVAYPFFLRTEVATLTTGIRRLLGDAQEGETVAGLPGAVVKLNPEGQRRVSRLVQRRNRLIKPQDFAVLKIYTIVRGYGVLSTAKVVAQRVGNRRDRRVDLTVRPFHATDYYLYKDCSRGPVTDPTC